jgi:hypothetical protein
MQIQLNNTQLLTKSDIKSAKETIMAAIDDGEVSPLDIQVQIKQAEALIKELDGDQKYRASLIDEAAKYGRKFEYKSGEFMVKDGPAKYDWATTNDPGIAELLKLQDEVKAKVKQRQDFLLSLPSEGQAIVTGDGEAITVYPPAYTSGTVVQFTIKK